MKKATPQEAEKLIKGSTGIRMFSLEMSPPKQATEKADQTYNNDKHIPWFDSDSTFPERMNERARMSTTHGRILNDKVNYTTGDGFAFEGTGAKALEDWATNVNPYGETLREVFERESSDLHRHGNAYIEVEEIKGALYNTYHKDASCCRVGKDGKTILYSRDWKNWRTKSDFKPIIFPKFPNFAKVEGFENKRCILHIKKYESGYHFYGVPEYMAAYLSGWLDIEYQIPKYNLTRFHNQFRPSGMLIFTGQNLTPDEQQKLINDSKNYYSGEGNNSKIMVFTVETSDVEPKWISFDDAPEGAFRELQNLATENIIAGHGWHPSLMIAQPGKLSNASDIRTAYEFVMSSTIQPAQNILLEGFKKIFNKMNLKLDKISILNSNPVSFISEIDPKQVLTKNELRAELGFAPLKTGGDDLIQAPTLPIQQPNKEAA